MFSCVFNSVSVKNKSVTQKSCNIVIVVL